MIPSKFVKKFGKVCAVFGGQWGDEGKGKLIDILAEEYDFIVRATGGANAGHTIYFDSSKRGKKTVEKIVFHLVPSGIFHRGKIGVLGNGMVIHFPTLFEEIDVLRKHGVSIQNRLFLSPRAHMVFEYHKLIDGILEERKGKSKVGTTRRGIGPAYTDKISRMGIRAAELLNFSSFKNHYLENVRMLSRMYGFRNYDTHSELRFFEKHRRKICRLFIDVPFLLKNARDHGKSILLEGANGTLLDIDHGTYPFVTSSNASLNGLLAGCGLPPLALEGAIGVMKAYSTRVGSGPFPTELHGGLGDSIREQGGEYGATTGRPRRCGWFDAVAGKYSVMINGMTGINLTKLDVLTGIPRLKIGIAYRYRGKKLPSFPHSADMLQECKVEYRELPGWKESIAEISSYAKLPQNAKRYIETLEKLLEAPVVCVGNGYTRKHMIFRG